MSTIQSASFIANYQTTAVFDRSLTESEVNQLTTIRTTAIAAGRQCTPNIDSGDGDGTKTSYWASVEDANSYAATMNAFSPAPTTACVVTAV